MTLGDGGVVVDRLNEPKKQPSKLREEALTNENAGEKRCVWGCVEALTGKALGQKAEYIRRNLD